MTKESDVINYLSSRLPLPERSIRPNIRPPLKADAPVFIPPVDDPEPCRTLLKLCDHGTTKMKSRLASPIPRQTRPPSLRSF